MGSQGYGIDPQVCAKIAAQLVEVRALGVELAIVVGGGNIFRGLRANEQGMDRGGADHMAMLATVINALALQDAIGVCPKKPLATTSAGRYSTGHEKHREEIPTVGRRRGVAATSERS